MKYINYAALKNVMITQKPFRGTTNRFPLSHRKQSYKYFLHETDADGQSFMRIILGDRWTHNEVPKKEYDADPNNVYKRSTIDDNGVETINYVRYHKVPNEVGIVRSDNTFEFTVKYYGQGDMTILSNFVPKGYFMQDCRRGGMILKHPNGITPIYKGMRVDCDTMLPSNLDKHRLYTHRVNRKMVNGFLKRYEDFFKVAEVMMKTVSFESFCEIAHETAEKVGAFDSDKHWVYAYDSKKCADEAEKMMLDSPLDAAALFCLGIGRDGILSFKNGVYHVPQGKAFYLRPHMESMYKAMRRAVAQELYKRNPDVLNVVEYEFSKSYPQSSWDYIIEVDGEVKEQL